MKKLIYAVTVTLTCLAAIPVTLVSSSIHAAAAAEQSCQSTSGFATSSGIVRGQLDGIARCHSTSQQSETLTASEQFKSVIPAEKEQTVDSRSKVDRSYLSCNLPVTASPGDLGYRAAVYRCGPTR